MKKVIFCEIAWMKYYSGTNEYDKPKNGGKYIGENEDGGEIYNFCPHNHKCYGYVMHYGTELHIERYDKIVKSFDEVRDMTVVWVASDGKNSKIVGWYEHATMFRYWQLFYDSMCRGDRENDYNFVASESDCYLIPEEDRSFVIPRASIAGAGRGMGQSQVWYADSKYAQEEFVPQVLEYLETIKEKCRPIYYKLEDLSKKAEDHGESTQELMDKSIQTFNSEDETVEEAFAYINLAIEKDDCHDTRALKGNLFDSMAWYDEAEEEYKQALYYEQNINTMDDMMYVELMLGRSFLAIDLGEKIRARKDETERWAVIARELTFSYISEGEYDAAKKLIEECENDKNRKYDWLEEAKNSIEDCLKKA